MCKYSIKLAPVQRHNIAFEWQNQILLNNSTFVCWMWNKWKEEIKKQQNISAKATDTI